jgi:hypothetical protein
MKLNILLVLTRGAIFSDGWAHGWVQRLGGGTRTPLMGL